MASSLERLGYAAVDLAEEADVIVLNTCVVRQSAEDKAYGRLTSLRPLKTRRPDLVVNLMGCLVGVKGDQRCGAPSRTWMSSRPPRTRRRWSSTYWRATGGALERS